MVLPPLFWLAYRRCGRSVGGDLGIRWIVVISLRWERIDLLVLCITASLLGYQNGIRFGEA